MDRSPSTLADRPLLPSKTKLTRERRVNAIEYTGPGSNPTDKTEGIDVSDWYTVLVTAHPSNPVFTSNDLVGAEISLRVWRWREFANHGTGRPTGQWFAGETVRLTLSGNAIIDLSMEQGLMTMQAERMFFQVVDLTYPNAASVQVEIGVYGIGDKRGSTADPTPYTGIMVPTPDPTDAAAAASLAPMQDAMLSNLAGDFTATYTAANRITCTGTFEIAATSWMDSHKVIAVGRKPNSAIGTETEFDFRVRWYNLDCSVNVTNATTFDIYLADNFFLATDDIIIFIAGPRHRYEVTGIDGTKRQQTRDEAFVIATQSERIGEIDPLDQRYVPDILADGDSIAALTTVDFYLDMAGYRFLSIQWFPQNSDLSLLVEATNEDNGTVPASCDYLDVTNAWFGAASYTANAFLFLDTHTAVKYIHIEVTNSNESLARTHKLFARRLW